MARPGTEPGYWTSGFPVHSVAAFLELAGKPQHTEIAVETGGYFKRYATASELEELVLVKGLKTLHVGAVWSGVPQKAPQDERLKLDAPAPARRMFVVDIDLQDYPLSISKEDQAGNDRALPCVLIGIEILKRVLSDGFGFEQTATFYSGRRGAHLYVLDERAVGMSDEARAAVTAFFSISSTDKNTGRLHGAALLDHPNFSYLYNDFVLDAFTETMVKRRSDGGVGVFDDADGLRTFLDLLDIGVRALEPLFAEMMQRPDPAVRWTHLQKRVSELAENPKFEWVTRRLKDVVMSFCWPRADVAVSCKLNHLLKMPFSAHASTGRIAVPIFDPLTFDPASCPTVNDYESLGGIVARFDAFVETLRGEKTVERARVAGLAAPPPSPKEVDMEDLCGPTPMETANGVDDASPPPEGTSCVLEFERVLLLKINTDGTSALRGMHRSQPPRRPPVHWLDDDEVRATKARAEKREPSPQTLASAMANFDVTKTGCYTRIARYPVFYVLALVRDERVALERHARLLERMEQANEACQDIVYIQTTNNADPHFATALAQNYNLASLITPAFVVA